MIFVITLGRRRAVSVSREDFSIIIGFVRETQSKSAEARRLGQIRLNVNAKQYARTLTYVRYLILFSVRNLWACDAAIERQKRGTRYAGRPEVNNARV